jgi:hypothetical protein
VGIVLAAAFPAVAGTVDPSSVPDSSSDRQALAACLELDLADQGIAVRALAVVRPSETEQKTCWADQEVAACLGIVEVQAAGQEVSSFEAVQGIDFALEVCQASAAAFVVVGVASEAAGQGVEVVSSVKADQALVAEPLAVDLASEVVELTSEVGQALEAAGCPSAVENCSSVASDRPFDLVVLPFDLVVPFAASSAHQTTLAAFQESSQVPAHFYVHLSLLPHQKLVVSVPVAVPSAAMVLDSVAAGNSEASKPVESAGRATKVKLDPLGSCWPSAVASLSSHHSASHLSVEIGCCYCWVK